MVLLILPGSVVQIDSISALKTTITKKYIFTYMFWSFSNKNVTPPTVIPNTYICGHKVHVFPKYLQNVAKQRQVTLVTGKELLAEVTP